MSFLAFFALRELARRAVTRALKVHIALASCPTLAKHKFLTVAREIDKRLSFEFRIANREFFLGFIGYTALSVGHSLFLFFSLPHNRPDRHGNHFIRGFATQHVLA